MFEAKRFRSAAHWGHFEVEVQESEVKAIYPSARDQNPSPILQSVVDTLRHPTRISGPMVRRGFFESGPGENNKGRGSDPYLQISWDEALDLTAGELSRVKKYCGNKAIYAGSYGWASAGRFHHAQSQIHRFLNLFGGYTFSRDTYSTAALTVLLPHILGEKQYIWSHCTGWTSVAQHSRLIVMFGGVALKNSQVNPGGTGNHLVRNAMSQARANGADFVNFSPLASDAARELEADWMALFPNTDTGVILGLSHTLLVEGLYDSDFVKTHCVGFSQFKAYLLGQTDGQAKCAEWAAAISGISADAIRQLARRMAADRTFIILSWSIQRTHHGEQAYWAAIALAAMLGQIGLPGGGIGFGYGSVSGMANPGVDLPLPTLPIGRNSVDSFIPVARIADLLLHPGEMFEYNGSSYHYPSINLVYWAGGNPFHHHQDINRLLRAWQVPDTIIIQDPWWTPAARHADIVLPATTALERNDIGVARLDPYMTTMEKAIEPVGDARNDHDIFKGLAARLGFEDEFTEGRDEFGWLRHMYETARGQSAKKSVEMPNFDEFWQAGSFMFPPPEEISILFKDFRSDPCKHPLTTPSGKIEIYSEDIASYCYDDCPGHPVWLEPCEWLGSEMARLYPLHLISNQPRTRLHSQLDPGITSAQSKIEHREPVRINPGDAHSRQIRDGDVVRVFNSRGCCLAGAILTNDVRPGVVELSTGAWYDPLQPGVPGTMCVHGNPNVLTRDVGTSKLAQGPSAHTALVEIERYDAELPAIRVFDPPTIINHSDFDSDCS